MKYLTEIEKLLKKTIPLSPIDDIDLDRHRGTRARGERRERSESRRTESTPRRGVTPTRPAPSVLPRAPRVADAEPSRRCRVRPARPSAKRRTRRIPTSPSPHAGRRRTRMLERARGRPTGAASAANRPVPALLMKRTTASATPSAPEASVPAPDAAPEERPDGVRDSRSVRLPRASNAPLVRAGPALPTRMPTVAVVTSAGLRGRGRRGPRGDRRARAARRSTRRWSRAARA